MDTTPEPKIHPRKRSVEEEKAAQVIRRKALAGEPINQDEVAKEAGVSSTPVRRAIAAYEAVKAAVEEQEIILSASAQEKYDAKIRAFMRDFDHEVEVAARKLSEEIGLRHYREKLEEVEALLNSPRWAVMPIAHFKLILACLHPDNAREGHEPRFQEAFAIFNGYKPKLIDLSSEKEEKDRRKRIEARGAPLPRTIEEMLARKKMKGKS